MMSIHNYLYLHWKLYFMGILNIPMMLQRNICQANNQYISFYCRKEFMRDKFISFYLLPFLLVLFEFIVMFDLKVLKFCPYLLLNLWYKLFLSSNFVVHFQRYNLQDRMYIIDLYNWIKNEEIDIVCNYHQHKRVNLKDKDY